MKVLKFGGTSIGTVQMMKDVAGIINNGEPKIVVLSAMSGTTDRLVEISEYYYKKEYDQAKDLTNKLEKKYIDVISGLFKTKQYATKGEELVRSHFFYIRSFTQRMFTIHQEKAILAQGELLSTALFHFYLEENGTDSVLLEALNFMRIDKSDDPDTYYIKENLKRELNEYPGKALFITQGYICRDAYGEVDNLKRGGSDYSASLIGEAIEAEEIQIWTDIDGLHNNDPRYVTNTRKINRLSFDEAAELAYFGAKILHPSSVMPCKTANIPVRLKNTHNPEDEGTLITSSSSSEGIKAIAAKDGITAIKIKSGRMLMAYGFLRKVFEIFEIYKTPIDMITTSEVAVSLTIDNPVNINKIADELKKFGTVETDADQTIVCIVGDLIAEKKGYAMNIFHALREIPVRMISYGGSRHNISVLISTKDKKNALEALSKNLFTE